MSTNDAGTVRRGGTRAWWLAASGAAALVLSVPAWSAQQQTTRTVEFSYNASTGQVETERVDPGLGNCAETLTQYDKYGNKTRVVVQPCAGVTSNAATFTARLTLNEFAAQAAAADQPSYPAGAFLTRTRTGALAMEAETNPEPAAAETRAVYHTAFGAAVSQTAVAHQDTTKNLTTRSELDGFGRVSKSYAPVYRDAAGATTESHVETTRVYCRGNLASADANANLAKGCIIYRPKVSVDYDSGLLFDSNGAPSSNLEASAITAYFIETVPRNSGGTVIGARSRIHYDSLHREIAKETESYSGQWTMSLTVYDRVGNVAASWSGFFGRAADGTFTAPSVSQMQRTAARDLLHRPTEQRQYWRAKAGDTAVEVSTQLTYNGLESTVTVPAGSTPDGVERTSTAFKNGAGQVTQTVDAYGATLSSAYDPVGNLQRTVDALGNTTTITYTASTARFKVKMVDPDQGTWSYSYDALGQLVSQTDNKSQTTGMAYDVLGRMASRTNADLNGAWFYGKDASGAWCAYGLPRLCESRSGNSPSFVSRTKLGYDKLARAYTTTNTLAGRDFVSTTTFDTLGRVQKLKYPSGFTVQYAYSAAGGSVLPGVVQKVYDAADSTRVFWSIANISAGSVFDAHGNVVRSDLGNGLGTNHLFDAISGKALRLRAGTAASGYINAQDHSYTYDKVHNVAERRENLRGTVESFVHDRLNRLVGYTMDSSSDAEADRTVTVDYNAIGNILYKSDVGGYTYGPGMPHAVRNAGATDYHYDANGQLDSSTGVQTRTNVWTAFNQPQSLSYRGSSTQFTYDEGYKRVSEVINDGATVRNLVMIHPDNQGGLGFEREITMVSGARTRNENRHYISVGGAMVAVVKTLTPVANDPVSGAMNGVVSTAPADAGLVVYWHRDALGSIVSVSDRDGTVMERMAFDPWGRRLRDTGLVDAYLDPAHGDRGFTGHEHLDELSYIHMNGRVFDPFLGRFLSADSIIEAPDALQSYNRYSYVLNNPMRYADPSGHCIWDGCAAEVFMVVAGTALMNSSNKYWRMVGAVMTMYALGPTGWGGTVEGGLGLSAEVASMVAGGYTGFVSSNGDVFATVSGAVFAGAFNAAGGLAGPGGELTMQQLVAHAMLGCAQTAMGGGQCGPGAMSAAAGKLMTNAIAGARVDLGTKGVLTAIAGGTASVIGGGKFANGAFQGAIAYLFNYLGHCGQAGNCMNREGYSPKRYDDGIICNGKIATCGDPHSSYSGPGDYGFHDVKESSKMSLRVAPFALDYSLDSGWPTFVGYSIGSPSFKVSDGFAWGYYSPTELGLQFKWNIGFGFFMGSEAGVTIGTNGFKINWSMGGGTFGRVSGKAPSWELAPAIRSSWSFGAGTM
jgi:RHS repeat-associated protein